MKRRVTPRPDFPDVSDEAVNVFLGGRDPAEAFRDPHLFAALRRKIAERALGAELDLYLDTCDDGNPRHGHNRKTVDAAHGGMHGTVPRNQQGSFRPQLIRPGCRRRKGLDDLVLSLFASDMRMRDIRDRIAATCDVSVSAKLISKITDEAHQEIVEWQQRPLEQVHATVCLDAIFVKIREDGAVSNQAAYPAIGVDCEGCKQVLELWIKHTEGAGFWLQGLKELNKLGVADILIAVTDALQGFPQALAACRRRPSSGPASRICCATRWPASPASSAGKDSAMGRWGLPY